jgi:hypothetical protein
MIYPTMKMDDSAFLRFVDRAFSTDRGGDILAGTTIDRCVRDIKELSADLGRSIRKVRQDRASRNISIYTGGHVGIGRRTAG